MATTAVQAVEKNITSVALADIQPSNYNPRKNFDETSLAELAESIRQQGVLQPIGVRPIADNRFEIVFGERRYRASLMAELAEIPAIVMEISDETAEEMAITENLQRKDVTPIEEANAYQKLIDSGRHDVQSLTVQFGKTEAYIRTRLKFVSLIPEIALLLEQDEITISVASEICRYGEEIQREVYDQHLKEGVQYNSWRGMKAYEDAEKDYGQELNGYTEKCEAIRTRSEAGEISLYLRIESNDITLCYVANTATTVNGTATEMPLSPIEKLEKQDKRNKEIALEKTVEDTKKRILEVDMSERKFGQDEEKMVYFFLLSSLRKEHFNEVGIEDKGSYYYLTSEDKMRIIENLTAKQKAVIRRDYLIANFKDAFGNNATASLLLGFAQKHMPEELANIQDGYNEVYEKRHQRIKEKKAALQEQATQEAEQPDEPQPEAEAQTEPQTEEIAA